MDEILIYVFGTELGWHFVEEGRGTDGVAGPYASRSSAVRGARRWASASGVVAEVTDLPEGNRTRPSPPGP
jgi:hypothetical protein